MNLMRAMTLITDFADRFIPPAIAADEEQKNQARVFLISHLFGPFIGNTIPLALFLLDPAPGYKIGVLAASITGFLAFPILLKLTGWYRFLAVLSVQNLLFCVLWSCYFYGGVTSPTLSWVLIIPLLAFFYIGSSMMMRSLVIGLMLANFAVFMVVYLNFPAPIPDISMSEIENLGIISMIATALYVAMMALYFAKVHESQSQLETLAGKHMALATELRLATAEAERASAAKADFLAKMSHELRTPLNAIIGYSQMLQEEANDDGDAQSAADLNRIYVAGVHLLKMINEILDLAKIDAGKAETYLEDVSPATLIRTVVDGARSEASQRGNVIDISVSSAVGICKVDEKKVEQILHQVVDNAVKFTSKGIISIEADIIAGPDAGEMLRVQVKDTGCGISEVDLAHLFEQFTVLGDSSTSKYGGTGLGLALSRKLCRLMGGDISAQSTVGVGSIFTIALPISRSESSTAKGSQISDPKRTATDIAA
jgi:signal transduction histidine kinase